MTVLAHVGGMPLEEALLSLGSAGSCLLAARVWLGRLSVRVGRGHSVSSAASNHAASSASRSEASAARSAWSSRSRP
jgi:hypothetical protein